MGNVRIIYNQGEATQYIFPQVQSETGSNKPDDKSVIIEGNRGAGSIYIPGGKKSLRITVTGILVGDDYDDLTAQMLDMTTNITTDVATLKLQHKVGDSWDNNDWSHSVRRVGDIVFEETLRTDSQKYSIEFLVLTY